MEGGTREDIKDKLDLIILVKLSNHLYYIFNYTYTGTTILTISTLLYQGYHALES
jgi:hypothetical protein